MGGGVPSPSGPSQAEIIARQAEQERQRIEREAEEQRAIAASLERQRHEQFQRDKESAVSSLKGIGGSSSELKTAGTIQDNTSSGFGLKGVGDTGIKNVKPDRDVRDLGGTDAAWKQLHAAAYLAGLSLRKSGDPVEAAYLAEQAARVMNGDPLGVVVPPAPARPQSGSSGFNATAYQAVTRHLGVQLKTQTAALSEKKKNIVEAIQRKETAVKEVADARKKFEELESELKQSRAPVVAANTAPNEADKKKDDALAIARAALLAAQQAEAETSRVAERADAEAKFATQQINSTLISLNDMSANPALAESMRAKLPAEASPAPATTPKTVKP